MTKKDTPLRLVQLIPNVLTLGALIAGLSSIQLAINGSMAQAAMLIFIAAILDMLDGATARLLKASSAFGAELDSLSDFLAFGVAPSVLLYTWSLQEVGKFGWLAAALYAVATALRLARYNVLSQKPSETPAWAKGFFAGVPAPGGAGLVLFPLFVWFQSPIFFNQYNFAAPLICVWTILVAALMVSRLPTFSSKQIKVPSRMAVPALAIIGLLVVCIVQAPWITLAVIGVIYFMSIPFSVRLYRKRAAKAAAEVTLYDLALGVDHDNADTVTRKPTHIPTDN